MKRLKLYDHNKVGYEKLKVSKSGMYLSERQIVDYMLSIDKDLKDAYELLNQYKVFNSSATIDNAAEWLDELITKLMKGASKAKNGKITGLARGLNSVPGLLTTVFISPYILGWFIPRLTYKNTRRIHAKEDEEKQKKIAQTYR